MNYFTGCIVTDERVSGPRMDETSGSVSRIDSIRRVKLTTTAEGF